MEEQVQEEKEQEKEQEPQEEKGEEEQEINELQEVEKGDDDDEDEKPQCLLGKVNELIGRMEEQVQEEKEHEKEQEPQEEKGEEQEIKERVKIQEVGKGDDDDEDEKPQCILGKINELIIIPKPVPLAESIFMVGNTPKLRQLQLLKFPDGTELRIMEKVAPKWEEVAIALGFDGARIETIEIGAYCKPRIACRKMFIDWLSGGHDLKRPTWGSLVQSLRAAKLTEIVADLLSHTIKIVSFKRECTIIIIILS